MECARFEAFASLVSAERVRLSFHIGRGTAKGGLSGRDNQPLRHGQRGSVLLCVVLWSLLSTVLAHRFAYSSFRVVGASMQPTLREGDWRLVNRWKHRLFGVQHGDVLLVRDPETGGGVVKRVIGLPGDVLQFRIDGVYRNYRRLREYYLQEGAYTWSRRHQERLIMLDKGEYFVLGDNRLNSVDSRTYGPVYDADILGVVTY